MKFYESKLTWKAGWTIVVKEWKLGYFFVHDNPEVDEPTSLQFIYIIFERLQPWDSRSKY